MSLAVVFPGQGSQSIGMLKELATTHVEVVAIFADAAEALGYDLWDVVQQGPEERLNSTDVTQPAMLAAGVATWRIWQQTGKQRPAYLAGHSLGEYTALTCAGVLSFTDAVKLVAARGRYMQEAVPKGEGAMAAILGLDDAVVSEVCQAAAASDVVEAVNFNSPGQVVIAGHRVAVERAIATAKQRGAKRAILLPVSAPSHCILMKPAADRLADDLNRVTFQTPSIPVLNNVDVAAPTDPQQIRDALLRQLYQPVRWVEIIQYMAAHGVTQLIECGPGRVLAGLNRRIEKNMSVFALTDTNSLAEAVSNQT